MFIRAIPHQQEHVIRMSQIYIIRI